MKNPKIIAAFALGCALVLLALVFSDFGERSMIQNNDGVRVAKAPERKHIAVADENGNGIADWRELIVPESTSISASDLAADGRDYTPPDTLTGQASIEFMKQLMEIKSGNSFAVSEEAFVEQFAGNILASSDDPKLGLRDILITQQNDPATLRSYVNAVADIFISEGFIARAGDELTILTKAVDQEDAEKLKELDVIAQQLTASIGRTKALPAPSSMTTEHINIINTATSLRNDILGMGKLYEDPMYAFIRIRRYDQDTVNITNAFFALEEKAVANGAQFAPTDAINFQ